MSCLHGVGAYYGVFNFLVTPWMTWLVTYYVSHFSH